MSAYACEPKKGSEPGVGWNWAKQVAKFAEAWVVTRANNRQAVEEVLPGTRYPNLHFVYVDLPGWMMFWKRGQRGVHLYYILWQIAAFSRIRKFIKERHFDVAHHITFVNDWMPSFLTFLNIPFVWGPIGSNPAMPLQFLPNVRARLFESCRIVIQDIFRNLNPLFLLTLVRAKRIIMINSRSSDRFPFRLIDKSKFLYTSANGMDIYEEGIVRKTNSAKLKVVSVGRLIYLKGFQLAIRAFANARRQLDNIELIIIGDGSERRNLLTLTRKLGVEEAVEFLGRIPRENVLRNLARSHIFLFPSFEGGGMVVLEAMAKGLPVICLNYGGPGEVLSVESGMKIEPLNPEQTVGDLADALLKLARDPELRKRMGAAGRKYVQQRYSWDEKGQFIRKVYESVLDREDSVHS